MLKTLFIEEEVYGELVTWLISDKGNFSTAGLLSTNKYSI